MIEALGVILIKHDVISHNVLDEKDCIQSFIFDKHHICDKYGAPFAAKASIKKSKQKKSGIDGNS